MTIRQFFKDVISSKSPSSAKRFVTLLVAMHFVVASFTILFISGYVVFYLPRGRVDIDLLNTLKEILKDDMLIIMAGLGFITLENAGEALVEIFRKAPPTLPTDDITLKTEKDI